MDKTPITVEQNAKFTLVVKNNGPDTAVNVKVTDALPDGLEYVSYQASPGTYYDPLTNVWTIGDMVNGSSATLKLVAKATKTGVFTNIAVVSSDTEDPNLENNRDTASLTVREPVKAVTVPMQPTGLPIGYLVIAVLMVLGGTLIPKRK